MFRFTYSIKDVGFLNDTEYLDIEIIDESGGFTVQLDSLKLREIYQAHKDVVVDIAKKHLMFSDSYLRALSKAFPDLVSEAQAKELIYGTPLSQNEIGKRPMSKLTQDILEEMERAVSDSK